MTFRGDRSLRDDWPCRVLTLFLNDEARGRWDRFRRLILVLLRQEHPLTVLKAASASARVLNGPPPSTVLSVGF